jgi:hypothetical protein
VVADDRCDEDDAEPKERLALRGEIQARGYLIIFADDDACVQSHRWHHRLAFSFFLMFVRSELVLFTCTLTCAGPCLWLWLYMR